MLLILRTKIKNRQVSPFFLKQCFFYFPFLRKKKKYIYINKKLKYQ
jgi:hypothetical protein